MPNPHEPDTTDPHLDEPTEGEETDRNARRDEEGKRVVDPRDRDELNTPDDGQYAKQDPGPQPGGGDESGHS